MTVDNEKGLASPTAEIGRLTGHTKVVSRVAFSPDESRLASCSADQTVKVWDHTATQCLATLSGHSGGVSDVCWHPQQDFVASASDDLNVNVWDVHTGKVLRSMQGHTHFVYCCKFHPYGSVLVSSFLPRVVHPVCNKPAGAQHAPCQLLCITSFVAYHLVLCQDAMSVTLPVRTPMQTRGCTCR